MNAKFTKVLAVLSALGIMLSFAACGKKDDETTAESTTAETTAEVTTSEETTAAPAEGESTEAPAEKKDLSKAEIVAEFNAAYTASYSSVKVTGSMSLSNANVNGKAPASAVMSIINKLVPSAEKSTMAPCDDSAKGYTNNGKMNLTEADVSKATYKDNGDGTATITINPVQGNMSKRGADAQGKLFNVYGDMANDINNAGLTYTNCTVTYPTSNYVTITYNTSTKAITKYDSKMVATLNLQGATGFMVLKNVNGGIDLVYEMHS